MEIRSRLIAFSALTISVSYAMGPTAASAARASRQIARQPILIRQTPAQRTINSPVIFNQNQRNLENQIEKLKRQVKDLELAQQSCALQPVAGRFAGYQWGMPSWWKTSYYKNLLLSGGLLSGVALGYAIQPNTKTTYPETNTTITPKESKQEPTKTQPAVPPVFKNDSERLWHELQPGKKMPYWFNIFKFNFIKYELEKDLALSGISGNLKNEEILNALRARVKSEETAEIDKQLAEMSLYDRRELEEQLANAKRQFPDKMPKEIWDYVQKIN